MFEPIYVFYGQDDFLVQDKINSLIEKIDIDSFNIVKYDLLETESDDVIKDLQTVAFFDEKKVIVVRNLNTLTKGSDKDVNKWVSYIEKPNPDVILIVELEELLDQSHPIGEALFNHAYTEKVKSLVKDEYPEYLRNMVKKYQYSITDEAIKELLERTNNDFGLISQEIEKLLLYTYDSKEITEKAVSLLVSRNLEENIYELTKALSEKNHSKMIDIFYDLMARNEEPLRVLNQITSKIRELMHTKLLLQKSYTQDEIAKHFNISSGKAYYLVKQAQSFSFNILEDYLTKLSELEFSIKSGQVDKRVGLELFLLSV